MTKTAESDVRNAISSAIDNTKSATSVISEAQKATHVDTPAVQRTFYDMMSRGEISLGPGLVPKRAS
jgi:hypothetical protein